MTSSLSPCRVLTPYPYSGLKIMFSPTVEVTESCTVQYSTVQYSILQYTVQYNVQVTESTRVHTPLSVLANVGGSLGLCLGYSLLDGCRLVKYAAKIREIGRKVQKVLFYTE